MVVDVKHRAAVHRASIVPEEKIKMMKTEMHMECTARDGVEADRWKGLVAKRGARETGVLSLDGRSVVPRELRIYLHG